VSDDLRELDELLDYARAEVDGPGRDPIVGFFEALSATEAERIAKLFAVARRLQAGDNDAATRVALGLVRSMPDEDDRHGAVVVRTFAETLLGRCRRVSSSGGNLYLGARPPGAQLRAFELLRLRTPLIPFAYSAANRALLRGLQPGCEVTLIDFGIGRGGQIRALLRNPVVRRGVGQLHVVGIEPDSDEATDQGALEMARRQVLDAAAEADVKVRFSAVAKRGEELEVGDFPELGGTILANAAFAVHHVTAEGSGGRDRVGVLALLRELGATTVVMTEPESDHVDDRLEARLLNAYRHYRTVAASLEAMLDRADAQLVFAEFFAPEVRNVVGHEGAGRTERHEQSATWAKHLEAAGWTVEAPRRLVPDAAAPEGFSLHESDHAFRLVFDATPLLGVLRAHPRGR